ncbi:MAG: hypothetical protein ACE5EA_05420 [Nitrospirota bacterium]
MIDIVADASPLIFLAKIGELNLLSNYKLFVPRQVKEEILKGYKKEHKDAPLILEFLKTSNATIVDVDIKETLPAYLGKGEQAVISYAIDSKTRDVLIDEGKARAVARFYKLKPKGTLGVLNDALIRGTITRQRLEEMVFDLVQKGYRIREEILIEFLRRIRGERK